MRSREPGRRTRKQASHIVVRDGPRGRELLVDGTFASFYRPGSLLTGSVWDALAAPVLLLPAARRRRVLILGLGGGSAARIVRALAPTARIVGVEVDPEVVAAARRWFDLDSLGVEVVIDDAQAYLARERGRWDAILDDVFVGQGSRVRKPDWLPAPGLTRAAARLSNGGILVSNTIAEAGPGMRTLRACLGGGVAIGIEGYYNRVLASVAAAPSAAASVADARTLRAAVGQSDVLRPTLPRLRFRSF